MKSKHMIYAFALILACVIVCCKASPSVINDNSVIGGHAEGDCCDHTGSSFCGNSGGTCSTYIKMCHNVEGGGAGVCMHKGGSKTCNVAGCNQKDEVSETCYGGLGTDD